MTREELRHDFHNEQGINWENLQGEPDIDYVMWLEDKIIATQLPLPPAEGAEEFLKQNHISGADFVYTTGFKNMVALVEQFAALHARKMVEEMKNDDFDKMNCLIGYLERWWKNPQSYPPVELGSVIDEAIEYLKSKEQ